MANEGAVLNEGGFSRLEEALGETLAQLGPGDIVDLLAHGLDLEDLVRAIATTPPFGNVLTERVQQHITGKGA